MSKFIELIKEANFCLWEDEPWKPEGAVVDWASNYDEEIMKFAELIVRHSAEIANYMEDQNEPNIGDAILNYFGVKHENN